MAFYNTYRPHQFSQVYGQPEIIKILQLQAATHAFHHAYLFTGPSGTGKTTTARILTMSLCCESMNGTGEPCGTCPSCQAVIESRHWDVIEIDGARCRGIDDAKELCYKAYYSPLGKRKVYLIDEAHQLTDPAWAAMLKLLEEPPPYLTIILCTTAKDKIPETIISRCQEYIFEALPASEIKSKLQAICQSVGINPAPEHLSFIAECSGGNMRQAENRLEQICLLAK